MRFVSLGSGSSGNAFVLETEGQRIILDCGVGIRTVQRAMAGADLPTTIVISHEHADHIRALSSVLKRYPCDVIATAGTLGAIGHRDGWRTVRAGQSVTVDSTRITFVNVSHDAAEPCGFFVETPDVKVAVLTDLGSVNEDALDVISAADIAVLESNYDDGMLRRSNYPAQLKRRIRSAIGHLSNEDCAATLAHAARKDMTAIWLSHLSHNNNTPEAAVLTTSEAMSSAGKNAPIAALARFETTQILPFAPPPQQRSLFDG